MLKLNLEKPGAEAPAKLRLSLEKGAKFRVTVAWDCEAAHEDDVDVHALEAVNDGNGAKVDSFEQVLSTYNTKKMSPVAGLLPVNPDGSFSTPSGGLFHTGDIRRQGKSETIIFDGSKVRAGANEIPLFATVHEADHGAEHEEDHDSDEEAAFADINVCTVTIADDSGKELGSYQLSDEFGEFNVVQLGSIMLSDDGGWEYSPVGRGFKGTMNDVLAFYS